jgi:hypothetical protein
LAPKIRDYIFGPFYLRVWKAIISPVRKSDKFSTHYRKFFVFLGLHFDGGDNHLLMRGHLGASYIFYAMVFLYKRRRGHWHGSSHNKKRPDDQEALPFSRTRRV